MTTGLVALGVLGGGLLLSTAPAVAAEGHGLLSSFNGSDAPGGPFSSLDNVAVDQSSNDVYVVDEGREVVDKFTSAGAYVAGSELTGTPAGCSTTCPVTGPGVAFEPTDVAVDPTTGDVYVVDAGHEVIDGYSSSGVLILQFNGSTIPAGLPGSEGAFAPSTGIAVDPATHDVYVADRTGGVIDKFTSAGVYVSQFPAKRATGIAVDSTGSNLYVAAVSVGVQEFSSAGVPGPVIDSSGAALHVAVDLATNDVYVADGTYITQYDSSGDLLNTFGEFGPNVLGSSAGIAVDRSTNTIYVSDDSSETVDIFAPGPTPEEPATEPASEITATTATLNGKLNFAGTKLGFYYDYNKGTSCVGGASTPFQEGEGEVAAPVSSLQPSAQYAFCLVAVNAFGDTLGAPKTFPTEGSPPAVETESASAVSSSDATLEAQVNPENQPTTYFFEYATEEALIGTSSAKTVAGAPPASALTGSVDQLASVDIGGGLKLGTTYYYRVVAENGTPPARDGTVEYFTTRGTAPLASTGAASVLTQSSANVTGTVNPETLETSYSYQYGLSTEYGASEPAYPGIEAGVGRSDVPAPFTLSPLMPGTTYHYRLVARNEEGTGYGQDETFTTVADQLPIVSTGPPSGISTSAATISGTVDPQEVQATYDFEYGTDTAYGTQVSGTAFPQQGAQAVTLSLQGLQPGTTYHYRLVASNPGGTAEGADQTFTTPGILDPLVFPVTAPLIGTPALTFPSGSQANTGTTETKKLTNAQKLAKALKACAKKPKQERAACKRAARKRYAVKHKATRRKK
ncbi:MAG TPA: hypothetical protein VFG23_00130 [Polyangia bacterium]|nr:hypothetical protein [Polyangia bacterium]